MRYLLFFLLTSCGTVTYTYKDGTTETYTTAPCIVNELLRPTPPYCFYHPWPYNYRPCY